MAKIKHNNFLDSVNEVITDAIQQGVVHLYAEGDSFNGRTIDVHKKKLFHFGTTGYLGLEQDPRLKAAAIDAITNYGTQFPLSKSYISNPLYRQLEEKVEAMYQNPIVITKNSTLGHLGVIPYIVKDHDAIILDHQVHWSVQSAAKVLKNRSVPVTMIRHNDLDMLEDKIKALSNKRRKIWYMADGIYSMFGDHAPIKELKTLCTKYPQLYLYIDDVHGMSWIGKNGTGYALNELEALSDNIIIFGTLSKTFGASGAVLVCANKKLYYGIKTFGGPLTFSAQLEPASVAAATASAKIHLSPEIYELQNDLRERIQYFNTLLEQTDLPLVDKNNSPVFFIGTGMPETGYNFVNRLMQEGFYVNLGLFPAVPVKNTGVRITISRHNQREEIKDLVAAMAHHFPKALSDTQTTLNRVRQAFKMVVNTTTEIEPKEVLTVQMEGTILNIDKAIWNENLGWRGSFDWEGLKFLEKVFRQNAAKEHNWTFKYLIIYDVHRKPILVTYFTIALWKDDMLATSNTSKKIQEQRKAEPYYLTSNVLSLGSLFSEGNHLFLNQQHPLKQQALNRLMLTIEELEHVFKAKMIALRDFSVNTNLHHYFQGKGFIRVQMPDSCEIKLNKKETIDDFIAGLSPRNRRHYRKEIQPYESALDIQVLKVCSKHQLTQIHELYINVHRNNFGLNTFSFPSRLFEDMSKHPSWEFITIGPPDNSEQLIGVMMCYTNHEQTYIPAFVGLDYNFLNQFQTYRQLLYQTIKRAIDLKYIHINLGMTAAFEKRKLGATISEKYAYIQASDNYKLEFLGTLES